MHTRLNDQGQQLLAEYQQQLTLNTDQLLAIRDAFCLEMGKGLKTEQESSLAMIPTMIDVLPDGAASATASTIACRAGTTRRAGVYCGLQRLPE